jgi:hypothetical protein
LSEPGLTGFTAKTQERPSTNALPSVRLYLFKDSQEEIRIYSVNPVNSENSGSDNVGNFKSDWKHAVPKRETSNPVGNTLSPSGKLQIRLETRRPQAGNLKSDWKYAVPRRETSNPVGNTPSPGGKLQIQLEIRRPQAGNLKFNQKHGFPVWETFNQIKKEMKT